MNIPPHHVNKYKGRISNSYSNANTDEAQQDKQYKQIGGEDNENSIIEEVKNSMEEEEHYSLI